jgi:hypothetical protein
MSRKLLRYLSGTAVLVAVVTVVLAVIPSQGLSAGERPSELEGLNGLAAGSYLLTQDSGKTRLLTIHADGTFIVTGSDQSEFDYSTNHGAWKWTSRRTLEATGIDFIFGDATTARVHYVIELLARNGPGYREVAGEYSGKVYAAGVDPLDPASPWVDEFGSSFTGQIIRVD